MVQEIPSRRTAWRAVRQTARRTVRQTPRRKARRMPGGYAIALTAIAAAAAVTGCAGSGSAGATPGTTPATGTPAAAEAGTAAGGTAAAMQAAFVGAIRRVLPSVVEIRTSSGLGSGVVFDSSGDIVTNAHVVGTGSGLQVFPTASAEPIPARIVGIYQPDDLAVIRVSDPQGLRPAVFGDSNKLVAGDIVLAIGNPLGLSGSVTEGIVSAVGRVVSEPGSHGSLGAVLHDTIQTSAAINPGNSGGALATLDGEVVGIPTLAANQAAGGAAPGIGFAVPSDTVVAIARQLIAAGG
jgi:putative serine protease PepD